jgi:hypothetical protein
MFVELDGRPEAIALVDAISYYPDRDPIPWDQWPAVGEEIEAVVSDHAEHNRQIKLRVGSSNHLGFPAEQNPWPSRSAFPGPSQESW